MGMGAVASCYGRNIAAALGMHNRAAFVRFRAAAKNLLYRFHIAAGGIMGVGTVCPYHRLGIAALSGMGSVVVAQVVRRDGIGR